MALKLIFMTKIHRTGGGESPQEKKKTETEGEKKGQNKGCEEVFGKLQINKTEKRTGYLKKRRSSQRREKR